MTKENSINMPPSGGGEVSGNETEQFPSPLVKKLYEADYTPTIFALDGDFDAATANLIYDISTPEERKELPKDSLSGGNELWQWLDEAIQKVGYPPKALENIYEGAKKSLEELAKGEALLPCLFGKSPEMIKLAEAEPGIKREVIHCAKRALHHINRLAKTIGKPELEFPDLPKNE